MDIVIQTTNLYTFNRDPRATVRATRERSKTRDPDSIGYQEAGRPLHRNLKRVRGYDTIYKRSRNHHKRNNAIQVKKGKRYEVLGKKWFHVADGAGTKWTPERNVFVVFYRKGPIKIAHINTHFHVVPEEDLAGREVRTYGKAAQQYVEHVRFVRQLMRQYKREGYVVFVTADGNTRPKHGADEWKYSAYIYLARGTFAVSRQGVDLIVHDNEIVRRVDFEVVDKKFLGQADHNTLIGTYRLRS